MKKTYNSTLRELQRVADNLIITLSDYNKVQEQTLIDIKEENTPEFHIQLQRIGAFMNGYLFSNEAIDYIYSYVKDVLNTNK